MAKERKGEKIGGGWFVFRRGKKTGRIGTRQNTMPFEHPTEESAFIEAKRLAALHPGEKYSVFGYSGVSVREPKEDAAVGAFA